MGMPLLVPQTAPLSCILIVPPLHRATVASVRPFGVFVRPEGHPQDALVHASQVNEQLSLSREDEDADKVKALEFFAPPHSQV